MTRARDLADLLTGGQTISTADNTAQITLTSTDTDSGHGPRLNMERNPSEAGADGDNLGQIFIQGYNDAGTPELIDYFQLFTEIADASDGTEDARQIHYVMTGGSQRSRIEHNATETVINEDSVDVDFRVESDGNANMLVVDGGNNRVGVGTTPDVALHVLDTSLPQTKIAYDSNRYMNIEHATIYNVSGASQSNSLKIASRGYSGGNDIIFSTGGTDAAGSSEAERMKILAGGNIDISAGHILLDNGYGINFAATSDASGMTSEILDDYEEGTWTASVVGSSGGTAQTMSGYYTKVGNKVYVHASAVSGLNLSSSSGVLVINGLPFTAKSTSYQLFHLAHNNAGTYPSGRTQAVGYVSGNTQIVGLCTGSGSAWGDFSIGSATSAGIIVSGTYEVA